MLSEADLPVLPTDLDTLFLGGISLVNDPAASTYEALQAREAPARVTMIDPNIRPGFIAGQEDSYRARGFVKYDGEWMTPAEVQLAQSDAAKDQARNEAAQRASDAQFKASMDQLQKQEDDKRARDEADRMRNNPVYNPIYTGGWGYGVTSWPNPAGISR